MANLYKNATLSDVPTSRTLVYTVPATANTQSILVGASISNVENTADYAITLELYDSSKSEYIHIGKSLPVIRGSTLTIDTLKVFMETGDQIHAQAGTANTVDLVLSILEITEDAI